MKAIVNGAWLHYVVQGETNALPVVFLHGFPFSHRMWTDQIALTAKTCRAIAYDIRGHGSSDVGDGQYTIEGHVDDLVGLMDFLQVGKAVLVGLSMGGYITLRALERNPERFLAAVLCDTRSEADTNEGKIRRFSGMKTVKMQGASAFADTFVRAVFAEESFANFPQAVQLIHNTISTTPALSIAGTLLALASRTDTTEGLRNITVPTLILVGENDTLTPPSAARSMHERIRGSMLHIIPGAAHMSNLENAQLFNELLLSFLDRVATSVR
jgi:3-oxoadipate enol-lactonase